MSTNTKIEWTDATWSPIRVRVKPDAGVIAREKGYTSLVSIAEKMAGHVGQHCEHVSPGCEHCYAETNNHRCLPRNGTGLPYDRRSRDLVEAFVDEKVLLQPLKWRSVLADCIQCGLTRTCVCQGRDIAGPIGPLFRPRRIFVESQSDLFHENVTDEMLCSIFKVMCDAKRHIFQVLTKRPERMLDFFSRWNSMTRDFGPLWPNTWPQGHIWLGVSVENQATADQRIPLLLQTSAAVRFISAEPLLEPVSLALYSDVGLECSSCPWRGTEQQAVSVCDDPDGEWFVCPKCGDELAHTPLSECLGGEDSIDWVICGGESGPGARPMHPDWARSLRDQCQAAGVAFFMKQMGSVYGPKKGHDLPADLDIKQFPEAR